MSAHDIHALSGAYAVDALDDLERARFEEHLAACDTCQAEVASLQDATLLLSDLTEVAPPAAVRAQVLGEIGKVRPLPPASNRVGGPRQRSWTSLVAAAAVLGVLGSTAVVVRNVLDDSSPSQAPNADAVISQVLTAADVQHTTKVLSAGASATVFRSASAHHAVLVTRGMAPAPADRVYELWFMKDGNYVSAGLMGGGGDRKILVDGDPNGATGFGVTIEAVGGSPTGSPSLPPVAWMNLGQTT